MRKHALNMIACLLALLFLKCTPTTKPELQPDTRPTYQFDDGLLITGMWEESCQNGKLDKVLHNFAIKWEKQLLTQALDVSAKELTKLGTEQYQQAMRTNSLVRGRDNRQLRRVFNRLRKHIQRKDIDYSISLVEHHKRPGIVNAWVTADGDIFVTKAMMDFVQSEDELAFVVAHELAHIENLLPDKRLAFEQKVLNITGDHRMGQLLKSAASSALVSLNQYDELIADRAALYLVYNAGYDPEKSLDFFYRLDKHHDDNKSYWITDPLMRTHPYDHVRFSCLSRYLYESRQHRIPREEEPAIPRLYTGQ